MVLESKFREVRGIVASLQACARQKHLYEGIRIHANVLKKGLLNEIHIGSSLVNMYAKCGALARAHELLDQFILRDVISWNALIAGYAQQDCAVEVLDCFNRMQEEAISPNAITFACILKACGTLGAIDKGEEIHSQILRDDALGSDVMLGTALVDMYAKCGALAKVQQVFDELPIKNVVSWNALISGYAQHNHGEQALRSFENMRSQGFSPDAATFSSLLKACGCIGAADKGEAFHAEIMKDGLLGKDIVLGNALLDMYAKCGQLVKAQHTFDELLDPDLVSWNALIAGYTQHGHGEEALKCYECMRKKALAPNEVTLTCILKACGSIGAAQKGKDIHVEIVREGLLEKCSVLGTALLDMYAKCGLLSKAREVFDELPIQDVVAWTTLVSGYIQHSNGIEAWECFEQMQRKGLSPNAVTYACMVDLFGRAGYFDQVTTIINNMLPSNALSVWFALLSACRIWGNVKLGRFAFDNAVSLAEKSAVPYVYMGDIYTAGGMHDDAGKIENLRIKNEAWKKPACCRISDHQRRIHAFCVGDESHPQIKSLNAKLQDLAHRLSHEGFLPDLNLYQKDIKSSH